MKDSDLGNSVSPEFARKIAEVSMAELQQHYAYALALERAAHGGLLAKVTELTEKVAKLCDANAKLAAALVETARPVVAQYAEPLRCPGETVPDADPFLPPEAFTAAVPEGGSVKESVAVDPQTVADFKAMVDRDRAAAPVVIPRNMPLFSFTTGEQLRPDEAAVLFGDPAATTQQQVNAIRARYGLAAMELDDVADWAVTADFDHVPVTRAEMERVRSGGLQLQPVAALTRCEPTAEPEKTVWERHRKGTPLETTDHDHPFTRGKKGTPLR